MGCFFWFVGIEDPEEMEKYLLALQEASEKISRSLFTNWEW